MKATEVLNRYANGERDFRRANLRGQSFKGQDLSGADFTEADIRGANFTNSTLKEANFTSAIAGVQQRWMIGQRVIVLLLSAVFEFTGVFFNTFFITYFLNSDWQRGYSNILGIVLIAFNIALYFIISRWGFTAQAMRSVASTVAFTVTIAFAGAFALVLGAVFGVAGAAAGAFVIAFIISVAVAVAVAAAAAAAVAIAVAIAFTIAVAVAVAGTIAVAVAGAFTIAIAGAFASSGFGGANAGSNAFTIAVAVTTAFFGGYIALRALKGGEKFALVHSLGITLAAIGGTSFRDADLTEADFTGAILKSTNFTNTWEKDD